MGERWVNPNFEQDRVKDPFAPSYFVTQDDWTDTLVEEDTDRPYEPPVQTSEDVPEGTVKDVLEWVGDDVTRAHRALVMEETREKPRASLTTYLESLIQARR